MHLSVSVRCSCTLLIRRKINRWKITVAFLVCHSESHLDTEASLGVNGVWAGEFFIEKYILTFIGQSILHLSCRDAWLLLIMNGQPIKGAEPCNQLPSTKTLMNITDSSNLNISAFSWNCLKPLIGNLIWHSFLTLVYKFVFKLDCLYLWGETGI